MPCYTAFNMLVVFGGGVFIGIVVTAVLLSMMINASVAERVLKKD